MSEAMSSVEIEDVLSSIRRLVSEDLRPVAKPAPEPAPEPAAKSAEPPPPEEKLLLTPALRVVADRDAVPHVPAPPARPTPMPRLHLGIGPATDARIATLERAVEAQEIEWESEVGDPAPLDARMEWTEDGWAVVADVDTGSAPAFAAAPEVPSWAQPDPDQADPDQADPDQADPDQDAGEIGPDHDDLEPAAPIAQPYDHWADRAEAEAVAELREAGPAEVAAPSDEALTYDEQVLRDLVRDLIREELQGALGERITRNVRKLVRAEIARVIATQDLE